MELLDHAAQGPLDASGCHATGKGDEPDGGGMASLARMLPLATTSFETGLPLTGKTDRPTNSVPEGRRAANANCG